MDKFINFQLWNWQNALLILFSLFLLTFAFHIVFRDKVSN